MKKLFCYVFIFLVSSISQSSAIQNSLPKGAGLLLHVQVNDLDRYIDELSQKSEAYPTQFYLGHLHLYASLLSLRIQTRNTPEDHL